MKEEKLSVAISVNGMHGERRSRIILMQGKTPVSESIDDGMNAGLGKGSVNRALRLDML